MVKTQLILVIRENFSQWKDWLSCAQLDDYSAVDIMYFGPPEEMLSLYSKFLTKAFYFLHMCLTPFEEQINYLIRNDCDYYVVNTEPSTLPVSFPAMLDRWIYDGNHVIMARSAGKTYNNLVVYTYMSRILDHFGEQDIQTKIQIHAANNQREDLIYDSAEKFIAAATAINP